MGRRQLKVVLLLASFLALGVLSVLCLPGPGGSAMDVAAITSQQMPLGLMDPTYPSGTPPSEKEVELGKKLFFDPALSLDRSVSCGTCHKPDKAFSDDNSVSTGIKGLKGHRNSPTLFNVAFFDLMGWGGEHLSLEEQTLGAISNSNEMGLPMDSLVARVKGRYGKELQEIYGEVTPKAVAQAISGFQRTLISAESPFDRYVFKREEKAISEQAKRGFNLFLREARCIQCHLVRCDECHPFGGQTAFFTDNRFHNLGVGYDDLQRTSDSGRSLVTGKPEDIGRFKTPSLRNVALTAPYMHDGSLKTLEEVVEHYNKGGIANSNLDPEIRPLLLTEQEKKDLVEFMKTLSGKNFSFNSKLTKDKRNE